MSTPLPSLSKPLARPQSGSLLTTMEIMEGRLCEHVCACKRVCACVRCQQLDGCQLLKAERLNPLGETQRASNHRHNPTQLELLDRRRPPVLTHSTHINTSVSQKHA